MKPLSTCKSAGSGLKTCGSDKSCSLKEINKLFFPFLYTSYVSKSGKHRPIIDYLIIFCDPLLPVSIKGFRVLFFFLSYVFDGSKHHFCLFFGNTLLKWHFSWLSRRLGYFLQLLIQNFTKLSPPHSEKVTHRLKAANMHISSQGTCLMVLQRINHSLSLYHPGLQCCCLQLSQEPIIQTTSHSPLIEQGYQNINIKNSSWLKPRYV